MKKLILILLFSTVMFSSSSYAEWTKVGETASSGDSYYVELSTVKKNSGYIYYWELLDRLKPTKFGDLSTKRLYEVDCNIPRKQRTLAATYHTQPMGRGTPSTTDNITRDWTYNPPGSVGEFVTNTVCSL
jgi:hypothetical protein